MPYFKTLPADSMAPDILGLNSGAGIKGSDAVHEMRHPMLKEKGYTGLIAVFKDAAE